MIEPIRDISPRKSPKLLITVLYALKALGLLNATKPVMITVPIFDWKDKDAQRWSSSLRSLFFGFGG
jgi:hypothetical protein